MLHKDRNVVDDQYTHFNNTLKKTQYRDYKINLYIDQVILNVEFIIVYVTAYSYQHISLQYFLVHVSLITTQHTQLCYL